MKFSVAIPVYNGLEHLKNNFAAVIELNADEVVVVDDCSNDSGAEWIKNHYPLVNIIKHSKNTRFPKSANDAVAACNFDIVILLNQDVKPDKELIKVLKTSFHNQDLFAVSFNEQKNSWADLKIEQGMIKFKNGAPSTEIHDSFWASGGSAAFRKSMWDKLRGFDLIFSPGYFEDLDLCWRARKQGWKIIWHPQALVSHPSPQSSFDAEFKSAPLGKIKMRNYFMVQWKNFNLFELVSHFVQMPYFLLKNPGQTTAFLMAIYRYVTFNAKKLYA